LKELLAGVAALELGLRLYFNSRKESGTAFGPGRQTALARAIIENAKNFEVQRLKTRALSLELLKA